MCLSLSSRLALRPDQLTNTSTRVALTTMQCPSSLLTLGSKSISKAFAPYCPGALTSRSDILPRQIRKGGGAASGKGKHAYIRGRQHQPRRSRALVASSKAEEVCDRLPSNSLARIPIRVHASQKHICLHPSAMEEEARARCPVFHRHPYLHFHTTSPLPAPRSLSIRMSGLSGFLPSTSVALSLPPHLCLRPCRQRRSLRQSLHGMNPLDAHSHHR